ncbi:uncharacterized protein [Arachis hypogaea]|uniref:uncharacterized protein isoform X5 n=1 Tax=Arachis hypogaea TaxID=3818 RepID=UPI003B210A6D
MLHRFLDLSFNIISTWKSAALFPLGSISSQHYCFLMDMNIMRHHLGRLTNVTLRRFLRRFNLLYEECIEFNKLGLRDNVAQICVLEFKTQNGSVPSR